MLVALTILGIILTMGAGLLVRQRRLERDRLDRERALRAVSSEWVFLRTAVLEELAPRRDGPFLGPNEFADALEERHPSLTIEPGPRPGLLFVRVELDWGGGGAHRLVQEGYVYRGGAE